MAEDAQNGKDTVSEGGKSQRFKDGDEEEEEEQEQQHHIMGEEGHTESAEEHEGQDQDGPTEAEAGAHGETIATQNRRGAKGSEVFVGGLSRTATEADLRQVFGKFGEVVKVRLMHDRRSGQFKGFGFVRFGSAACARAAEAALHNSVVTGRKVTVRLSDDNDTLFVGNLPKEMKPKEVEDIIVSSFPEVEEVEVAVPQQNSKQQQQQQQPSRPSKLGNRGFAFVRFSTHGAAARALRTAKKPEFLLGGRWKVPVEWAEHASAPYAEELSRMRAAFVSGLPEDVDEEYVRNIFSPHGQIERVAISRKSHPPVAFVHFKERKGLDDAIAVLNGKHMESRHPGKPPLVLKVAVAKPPEAERRKREREEQSVRQSQEHQQQLQLKKMQADEEDHARHQRGTRYHQQYLQQQQYQQQQLQHQQQHQQVLLEEQVGYARPVYVPAGEVLGGIQLAVPPGGNPGAPLTLVQGCYDYGDGRIVPIYSATAPIAAATPLPPYLPAPAVSSPSAPLRSGGPTLSHPPAQSPAARTAPLLLSHEAPLQHVPASALSYLPAPDPPSIAGAASAGRATYLDTMAPSRVTTRAVAAAPTGGVAEGRRAPGTTTPSSSSALDGASPPRSASEATQRRVMRFDPFTGEPYKFDPFTGEPIAASASRGTTHPVDTYAASGAGSQDALKETPPLTTTAPAVESHYATFVPALRANESPSRYTSVPGVYSTGVVPAYSGAAMVADVGPAAEGVVYVGRGTTAADAAAGGEYYVGPGTAYYSVSAAADRSSGRHIRGI